MSAWTYRQSDDKADLKIVPPRLRIPYWKGLSAESEEKREPASDIDPPPLKWSDLRYVFDIKEDRNGKEAIQA